jgi:hypothetical protein
MIWGCRHAVSVRFNFLLIPHEYFRVLKGGEEEEEAALHCVVCRACILDAIVMDGNSSSA